MWAAMLKTWVCRGYFSSRVTFPADLSLHHWQNHLAHVKISSVVIDVLRHVNTYLIILFNIQVNSVLVLHRVDICARIYLNNMI